MSLPSSCQEYLLSAYRAAKRGNSALTIETYAARLGVGGSALKMILAGKRKLTVHQALRVARALRLSAEETAVLETLALRDSATEGWERAYFARRLACQRKELKVRTIHVSDRVLLADPLAMPVLVVLMESAGEVDVEKLARGFGVKPDRLQALVRRFRDEGLLESGGDGRHHVHFDRLNHKLLQKRYLRGLLEEAARRIETEYDAGTSAFTGYTFTASEETLERLKADLRSLMDRYLADPPDPARGWQVAQACFQLFPVARF